MPFAGNENPVKRLTGFFLFSTHRIHPAAADRRDRRDRRRPHRRRRHIEALLPRRRFCHPRIIQPQVQAHGIPQRRLR